MSAIKEMFSRHYTFAYLKVYVNDSEKELLDLYKEAVKKHNDSMMNDPYPNSGFDVFVPDDFVFSSEQKYKSQFLNMGIKCEMKYYVSKDRQFFDELIEKTSDELVEIKYVANAAAFDLLPRSSISKTPLMLANHVGLIDSGYRGWIIGALRNLSDEDYKVEKHTRLLQICHPLRVPIYVELISESDLTDTTRGSGGFGSTGKKGV